MRLKTTAPQYTYIPKPGQKVPKPSCISSSKRTPETTANTTKQPEKIKPSYKQPAEHKTRRKAITYRKPKKNLWSECRRAEGRSDNSSRENSEGEVEGSSAGPFRTNLGVGRGHGTVTSSQSPDCGNENSRGSMEMCQPPPLRKFVTW